MSTTYGTCAIQFPSSFVVMDSEEMEYLEGDGWSTYRGADALRQLTVIAGQAFSCYVTSASLARFATSSAATSATGWGLIVAAASVFGGMIAFAAGSIQAVYVATALSLYIRDRVFDAYELSIWKWSATLAIRKARP